MPTNQKKIVNKNSKQFKAALEVLRQGGTVVFPTETTYGLAADATNHKAVERLAKIKGRGTKVMSTIVADMSMALRFVKMSSVAKKLAKWLWPGPLTMVLPVKALAMDRLSPRCLKDGLMAVRVSSHELARLLSKELKRPIVATSANLAGKTDCYSVRSVKQQYKTRRLQPDMYLDVGVLPRRKPSTIIKISGQEIETLRAGSVKINKNHV